MRIAKSRSWEAFRTGREHGVWGCNRKRYGNWKPGERLVFFIENNGVAICEITGEQFQSDEIIWEDNLFPNRIKFSCSNVLEGKSGAELQASIKKILREGYGPTYGTLILFGTKIPEELEKKIEELI
ncbi:MAG: hypothetical protein KDK21_08100 [Mesotoga sp.]|jgi:hypothetical protein|nr:hypothetical protein [Mesotoga sp.]